MRLAGFLFARGPQSLLLLLAIVVAVMTFGRLLADLDPFVLAVGALVLIVAFAGPARVISLLRGLLR